nr:unnamed protein product [Digitaria exilis]CAB3445911.1 unnamed protein product [Digitaria exilis]
MAIPRRHRGREASHLAVGSAAGSPYQLVSLPGSGVRRSPFHSPPSGSAAARLTASPPPPGRSDALAYIQVINSLTPPLIFYGEMQAVAY